MSKYLGFLIVLLGCLVLTIIGIVGTAIAVALGIAKSLML